MARNFLTPIDMNTNEVRNFRLQHLASDPGSPYTGQMWFNTTDDVGRYFDGTNVIDITQSIGSHTHAMSDITGLVAALADKAPLASPAFTGNPTAPTPTAGDNDTSVATTAFVAAAVAALIDSAPGTLDTLNELAAALGDDPNFATTIANSLAQKTSKYAANVGGSTSIAVTHNLGTRDVVVSVHDISTNAEVECDVVKTSTSVVTLGFAVAPAAASLRVTVIG